MYCFGKMKIGKNQSKYSKILLLFFCLKKRHFVTKFKMSHRTHMDNKYHTKNSKIANESSLINKKNSIRMFHLIEFFLKKL